MDEKRHWPSSKLPKTKCTIPSELESRNNEPSAHKRQIHYPRARDSGRRLYSCFAQHDEARRHHDKDLPVNCHNNDQLKEELYYKTFYLTDKSSLYDDEATRGNA